MRRRRLDDSAPAPCTCLCCPGCLRELALPTFMQQHNTMQAFNTKLQLPHLALLPWLSEGPGAPHHLLRSI